MYDSKKVLVSLLVIAGLIKLFQLSVIVYNLIVGYSSQLLISSVIFAIYVAVHFFGLTSSIKELPCGLKAFSVQQIIFVILHVVGLLFLLWGQVSLHHQANTDAFASNEPLSFNKYQEGQDVLSKDPTTTTTTTSMTPAVESVACKWKRYSPIIMLAMFIFVTFIDLVTAILSWKGYKQLITSRNAVQTLTDLSETPDTEMMMTPSGTAQAVPLNVVYVPANLYDPLQTYQ